MLFQPFANWLRFRLSNINASTTIPYPVNSVCIFGDVLKVKKPKANLIRIWVTHGMKAYLTYDTPDKLSSARTSHRYQSARHQDAKDSLAAWRAFALTVAGVLPGSAKHALA